jgi:hypothetical protein
VRRFSGRSVFTAMGDRGFYDFLDDNPAVHKVLQEYRQRSTAYCEE